MRLSDVDTWDRPRERLLSEGTRALAERELVALVLRSGMAGKGAPVVADALLARFGGLSGLARASTTDLADVPGVGIAKAASLAAAFELGRRCEKGSGIAGAVLQTPDDFVRLVRPRIAHLDREVVEVAILDGANRVRWMARVTTGGSDRALLPIREILHLVLRHDGSGFALAHNHPAGGPQPSASDVEATAKLAQASEAVSIRFVDHVIVTDGGWASLRRSGYLD